MPDDNENEMEQVAPEPPQAPFEDRFMKAVLDSLAHTSPALAMLRQEWIDKHEESMVSTQGEDNENQ